jgi:hypothetical protein
MGLQMEQELWIESEWAEGLWCLAYAVCSRLHPPLTGVQMGVVRQP